MNIEKVLFTIMGIILIMAILSTYSIMSDPNRDSKGVYQTEDNRVLECRCKERGV